MKYEPTSSQEVLWLAANLMSPIYRLIHRKELSYYLKIVSSFDSKGIQQISHLPMKRVTEA